MLPGIYMVMHGRGVHLLPPEARTAGPFTVSVAGPLASIAADDVISIFFEGILVPQSPDTACDAEYVLHRFRAGGLPAVRDMDGYFQIAVVDRVGDVCHLVADPIATRPVYLYANGSIAAVAPTPTFFAAAGLGLPLSLDRDALYETFRLNHPLAGRTIAREVRRNRAFTSYEIRRDGSVHERRPAVIRKEVDDSITLDTAADRIRQLVGRGLADVLAHPRLRDRPIHLPLTSGMDSRHMLAELLAQRQPPALLRHVRVIEADHASVRRIAHDLDLPLSVTTMEEVDAAALTRAWVTAAAGGLHLHQLYLMAVATNAPEGCAVGFDGYLADRFFGYVLWRQMMDRRNYTPYGIRRLFPDRLDLAQRFARAVHAEMDFFEGPYEWTVRAADSVNRGVRYTGGVFPVLGHGALYFAPAAHRRAFEFFRTAPPAVLENKRARYWMFRRDFPTLGRYPDEHGRGFVESDAAARPRPSAGWILDLARGLLTAGRHDPAPETDHALIRRHRVIRRMVTQVAGDSALVADGHLPRGVPERLWRLHRAGAFLAWPLLSLITTDVAYRLLIKGEVPAAVADFLVGPAATPPALTDR
ncbi:MAG: hypothetical protein AB7F99_13010 [Vicinamibacterales bacterium]